MKVCKQEGCSRKFYARGLCDTHYRNWMFKMQRRGLRVARTTIADDLKDVLPATRLQMAQRLGVTERAIYGVVPKLHAEGKIHVSGHEPPTAHWGKWQQIFSWGPGKDAVLDPATMKAWRTRQKPDFAALLAPLAAA